MRNTTMIKLLDSNDILTAANLLSDTWSADEYKCYDRNEEHAIDRIISVVKNQRSGNLNYVAIKHEVDGEFHGYLLGSVYVDKYGGNLVFNVDDMIVDYKLGPTSNATTVKHCIDYIIEYCKTHKIPHWRADSAHSKGQSLAYVKFLNKNYNGRMLYGFKGEVQ